MKKIALLLFSVPGVLAIAASATIKLDNERDITLVSKRNDKGAMMLVVDGQFDDVTAWMNSYEPNPANVLLDEDNAMQLDDSNVDADFKRQVILVLSETELMDDKPVVDKADIAQFKKPGYLGPQFIAVQNDDVNTTGLDDGYDPVNNPWAKRATQARFSQYIDQDTRHIVGSITGANEIVFAKGTEVDRVHYGQLAQRAETFKPILVNFSDSSNQGKLRSSATTKGLHVTYYGGTQILSVSATQLANYFHGDSDELEWSTATVDDGNIIDMSNDIGDGTLIVSTDGGDYGHIPGIELYVDGKVQLNLVSASGIPTGAYGDSKVIPLGRVTSMDDETALYASLEPNGSDQAVTFGKVESGEKVTPGQQPWQTALGQLLSTVRSGNLRQQHAQAI